MPDTAVNERRPNTVTLIKELNELFKSLKAEQITTDDRVSKTLQDCAEVQRQLSSDMVVSKKEQEKLMANLNSAYESLIKVVADLKANNDSKLERAAQAIDDVGKSQVEFEDKFMAYVMELISAVKDIPTLSWKERVKQYASNLFISVGAILAIYVVISLCSYLFTHR